MPIAPESTLTAKIVEWNDQKGYGFLQTGKGRLFLHRGDFTERHKRPAVGDVIRFTMGKDAKGRICAQNAAHVNDGGRITVLTLLVLAGLLVLPAFALWRREVDLRWAGLYAVVMALVSYATYALDKRSARQGQWRISEAKLHLTELLGGCPTDYSAAARTDRFAIGKYRGLHGGHRSGRQRFRRAARCHRPCHPS
jgi:cold shock CspA family protein